MALHHCKALSFSPTRVMVTDQFVDQIFVLFTKLLQSFKTRPSILLEERSSPLPRTKRLPTVAPYGLLEVCHCVNMSPCKEKIPARVKTLFHSDY